MLSIIKELTRNATVDAAQLADLEQFIIKKQLKKGDFVQYKGDFSSKSYFVLKGCLRSYAIDEKGKEHIFMFAPEGWIMGDVEALASDKPCQLFIDAIEDTEIEIFEGSLFNKIQAIRDDVFTVTNAKLMRRMAVLQRRIIMLMSYSALARYRDFVETYPNIVQRVPQKMIASYLGITPEALSKIRGDSAKK